MAAAGAGVVDAAVVAAIVKAARDSPAVSRAKATYGSAREASDEERAFHDQQFNGGHAEEREPARHEAPRESSAPERPLRNAQPEPASRPREPNAASSQRRPRSTCRLRRRPNPSWCGRRRPSGTPDTRRDE